MPYEYKVVPAPTRGQKAKGLKTAEARFSNALETLMNSMATEGWSYLRADTLPSEERQGLTKSQTVYRSVLVFQRALPEAAPEVHELEPTPASLTPEMVEAPEPHDVTPEAETPEDDSRA